MKPPDEVDSLKELNAMRRRGRNDRGLIFAAFGAGMLLALCFPTKFMLFVLAFLLVVLGVFCCFRC